MSFELLFIKLNTALPEGRLFAIDKQTFISVAIQLFNVLLLAALLTFILYKPVRNFLQKRAQRISGQLKDAEDKSTQALGIKAQYEAKLAGIVLERESMLEAARLEAQEQGRQIIEAARNEAAFIKQRAEENLHLEKERLKEETRLYIIELSSLMAGKLVQKSVDGGSGDELFNDTLSEIGEAQWLS